MIDFKKIRYIVKEAKTILKYLIIRPVELPTDMKRAFIALAADYGNLGDLAITEAEIKMVSELLPDYCVIECPISQSLEYIKGIKKTAKKDDIFFLVGGGNISDKYDIIEHSRQLWMRMFGNRKMLMFPQSVDLENAKPEFVDRIKEIYSKNESLIIFARDRVSYQKLKELVNGRVELQPDIVLSLSEINTDKYEKRTGVAFCLRADKESGSKSFDTSELLKQIEVKFGQVEVIDTVFFAVPPISRDLRVKKLKEFWELLSRKQLLLTDRLHGMIFAYITNTPCVVLDNSNHKIKYFYDTWFRNKECSVLFSEAMTMEEIILECEKAIKEDNENEPFEYEKLIKYIIDMGGRTK